MNKKILFLAWLVFVLSRVQSQDSTKRNETFYRITLCSGIGGGRNLGENDPGLASSIEFEVQKKHHALGLGFHAVGEFQFLGVDYPNLSISSIDLMYSKIINNGKNYYSFGVGAGFITKIKRGEYIYSDPGLFGNNYYQKIRSTGFGIPICVKDVIVPTSHFGGGLSFYANINSNPFYNITVGIQIGKLRNGKEQPRAVAK